MKNQKDSQASGAVNPHDPDAQQAGQDSLAVNVHKLPKEAVPSKDDLTPEDFGKPVDLGKESEDQKQVKSKKK